MGSRRAGRACWLEGIFDSRQVNPERRTLCWLALDQNITATLLDDAIYGREPQTCALSFFFGGEKRLEDAQLSLFVHAFARVAYRKYDVGARLDVGVLAAAIFVVQSGVGGLNRNVSAL